MAPTEFEIVMAVNRLQQVPSVVERTPVMRSDYIDACMDAEVAFKCEHLQPLVNAFKIRGAVNTAMQTTDPSHGFATMSSGNHGQAVAVAARMRSVPSFIVMPRSAEESKRKRTQELGGKVIDCEGTHDREQVLLRVMGQTGASLIHPFNDDQVIEGQATAAMEFMQQAPHLDAIVVPVGGGGLISGTALAAHYSSKKRPPKIYGAEPEGANDAHRSFATGAIQRLGAVHTIADGLRAPALGDKTFPIIRDYVADILLVSDREIVDAMRIIFDRLKQVIEPSAAAAVAAVVRHRKKFRGQNVGIILSGGNVDVDRLPWMAAK